ncbi:hypothetical protein H4Q26_009345, partial [Puccinia striiformis f. sp. tritici PST-130]
SQLDHRSRFHLTIKHYSIDQNYLGLRNISLICSYNNSHHQSKQQERSLEEQPSSGTFNPSIS